MQISGGLIEDYESLVVRDCPLINHAFRSYSREAEPCSEALPRGLQPLLSCGLWVLWLPSCKDGWELGAFTFQASREK